jgi:hypothetical protein
LLLLLCYSLSLLSSSSLYSLFAYGNLLAKYPTLSQLKYLKSSLPLYLSDPLFSFLTNCASSVSELWLEQSHNLCYFVFFDALIVVSFCPGFSFPVLISYTMKIRSSSSIICFSRSFISSMAETLASNLKGRDLSTFCTIC